jgi:hypothetical protein
LTAPYALQGYRHRGYSVLLNADGAFSVHQALKYAWMLLPNYVQIDAGRMTAGSPRYPSSMLNELSTLIVVSKVRTAIEAQRASLAARISWPENITDGRPMRSVFR